MEAPIPFQMQRGSPDCSCRSHAPPPRGAHFRPQGRSGMQAMSFHQPAVASGRRDCARIAAQGDAGTMEPAAAPRKRRGGGDGGQERQLCRGLEPGEPPPSEQEEPRGSRVPGNDDGMGSAGSGADRAHIQPREEFWQYNTFQYWRNPLPPIDLAALEDVSADSLTETLQDKNEVVEIDMES
uniref:uncharacterized protein C9orf40 homolog n=1 Tax=Myodes glareolus TaxID=447135 RepID=UPI0020222D6B|nr:uncharacterized protein C9orf40 homolog [Myodes glareolus]